MLSPRVAVLELASVTLTVKVLVPVPVGVPEIAPELESVSPVGSAPEASDQAYGVVPPDAVTEAQNAGSCVPAASETAARVTAGASVIRSPRVAVFELASV